MYLLKQFIFRHIPFVLMEYLLRNKPLSLKIETINVCNARCKFCAYGKMTRSPAVMSMQMFEDIVRQYNDMGGGSLSLTPVVGEMLLDPNLMDRFRVLAKYPAIKQISFVTNLISHEKFSDDDWNFILARTSAIQVSIGGGGRDRYKEMFGVDAWMKVQDGLERLVRLKQDGKCDIDLHLAFRFLSNNNASEFEQEISKYRALGYYVSSINTYANWSGVIVAENIGPGYRMGHCGLKNRSCGMCKWYLGVLSNGTVTSCSCVDYDGQGLSLGNVADHALYDLWRGDRRRQICDSFAKMSPPSFCRNCTFYSTDHSHVSWGLAYGILRGRIPWAYYHTRLGG